MGRADQRRRRADERRAGIRRAGDRGFVTAEAAVVLPVLVTFTVALVWALMAASAQIQCVDAARAGARAIARQDPQASAVETARRVAPRGAKVVVSREGDLVRVAVEAAAPGPGVLNVHLRADAVALAEETVGAAGTAETAEVAGTVGTVGAS
ncbi:TadE family type IV pilus minor pilin [Streptomyces sp. NPDC058247]|uniref:TadE family type IV pilus minor pilin n=1 Tax=Streptomyces sp. NPDC058247 TaxID=3346401 RepID=UPI0036E86F02